MLIEYGEFPSLLNIMENTKGQKGNIAHYCTVEHVQ